MAGESQSFRIVNSGLVPILFIVGAVALIYVFYTNKYRQGLNHVPGPWAAGLSNLYRLGRVVVGRAHTHDIHLHRKYGTVVRIGPNAVSVSNPEAIQKIYGISANLPKSHFYPVNFPYSNGKLVQGIFATTDENVHRSMKKPIANLYSMTNVLAYEPLVDETIRLMVAQLNARFAIPRKPCVFSDWLQFYAFDVISYVTFSSRVGFMEKGEDIEGVMEGIWNRFKYFSIVGQMPWLDKFWDKSSLVHSLLPAKSSPIAAFAMSRTGKRIEELEKEKSAPDLENNRVKSKKDFLSSFLDVRAKKADIPEWYLQSWTISNMLAGSDTTAIYLRAIFYYLLRNPDSLRRVVEEIDTAEAEGRLSPIITYKESTSLAYLDACIKEAGRIHPAVGLPLERVVPSTGLEIDGYYLPGGTIVGVNAWTAGHDRQFYGADAADWNPERWLGDSEQRSKMERGNLQFGTGHRSCLGKHIALVEMYKLVPQLLREFEIRLVHPDREWTLENFWVVRQTDMDVYFERRATLSNRAVQLDEKPSL